MSVPQVKTDLREPLDRGPLLPRLREVAGPLTRRPILLIAVVFFLSSLVTGPLSPESAQVSYNWKAGPIYFGRPVSIWGDPPHYLVAVNSIIEDGDFDVANNYAQAERGDWDQGTRFRGVKLDHHVDVDRMGRELSFHSPFLPMILAPFCWPFRGTQWVESICIWVTIGVVVLSLHLLARRFQKGRRIVMLLAFATPLWCYSRDVWPEPWIFASWIVMLATANPWVQAAAAAAGILFKYSFAVVPATFALVAFYQRDWKRALIIGGASAATLLFAFGFIQYLFRHTDHFSLFHLGSHAWKGERQLIAPFSLRIGGAVGLLFDPKDGLLPFAPFLAWGFWSLRHGGTIFLPALSFFALHSFFLGWRGGSGFSSRYLVPLLPALVYATIAAEPRPKRLFWIAVAYSAVLCSVAGLLPAAAYDRTVADIFRFLWSEIQRH